MMAAHIAHKTADQASRSAGRSVASWVASMTPS